MFRFIIGLAASLFIGREVIGLAGWYRDARHAKQVTRMLAPGAGLIIGARRPRRWRLKLLLASVATFFLVLVGNAILFH